MLYCAYSFTSSNFSNFNLCDGFEYPIYFYLLINLIWPPLYKNMTKLLRIRIDNIERLKE